MQITGYCLDGLHTQLSWAPLVQSTSVLAMSHSNENLHPVTMCLSGPEALYALNANNAKRSKKHRWHLVMVIKWAENISI